MAFLGQTTSEDAVLMGSLLSLMAVVAGCVRGLLSCSAMIHMDRLAQAARSALASFRKPAAGSVVQERIEQVHLEQFRVCINVLCLIFSVGAVIIMENIVNQKERLFTFQQDCAYVATFGVMALCMLFPGAVRPGTADFVYVGLMILLSLVVAPFACKRNSLYCVFLFNHIVLALDLAHGSSGRFPVFLCSNGLYLVCSCSTLLVQGQGFVGNGALWQGISLVLYCMCTYKLENSLAASLQHAMECQEVKEVEEAVTALLKSSCEVVLELDNHGAIVKSAEDLANFLQRGSGLFSLHGLHLVDLVFDDNERELLTRRLAEPRLKQVGMAENMQVTMRDGKLNRLRLELLWFQFNRKGQQHSLMGVREYSDYHRLPADAAVSSDSSDVRPAMKGGGPVGGDFAIVGLDDDFPVQGFSCDFQARVGRLPLGVPILDFVRWPREMREFIQCSVNCAIYGEEPPPDHAVQLDLEKGHVQAKCRVEVAWGGEPPEPMTGRLHFFHLRRWPPADLRGGECLVSVPQGAPRALLGI